MSLKQKKQCSNGHTFYKSSDCPVCPICENLSKPSDGFLTFFSAPARRALIAHDIKRLKDFEMHTENEILAWHAIGPNAMKTLKKLLKQEGLSFKRD